MAKYLKKRGMIYLLMLVLCIMAGMLLQSDKLQVHAAGLSCGDYQYSIVNSRNVEITDYFGTSADITIPSEIDGRKVVSIGEEAFYGCNELKSVIIPSGVTYIDSMAFCECSSLENVIIPDTVWCINSAAFEGCKSLNNIIIPQGMKEIWCGVFNGCSSLKKITIPESVDFIGSHIFWNCSSLTDVEFLSGIVRFKGGFDALFHGCNNLKNVHLSNLDCFTEDGVIYQYDNGVKLRYCPRGKTGTVIIPGYVKGIDRSAFEGCKKINTVVIQETHGLEIIGERAFLGCSNLRDVTILNGVKEIGKWAFYDCGNLRSVTIPGSVTNINVSVFRHNNKLKNVYYEGSRKQWKKIIIDSGNDSLINATIHYQSKINAPAEATVLESGKNYYRVVIKGSAVSFIKTSMNSSKITVPDNVTIDGIKYKVIAVSGKTFADNKKLKSIVVGNNVTSIGSNAFANCINIESVALGTKVQKIGKETFRGCSKLSRITIKSKKLTSVGKNAFKGIKSSARIKVPSKKLGKYRELLKRKGQGKKVKII